MDSQYASHKFERIEGLLFVVIGLILIIFMVGQFTVIIGIMSIIVGICRYVLTFIKKKEGE